MSTFWEQIEKIASKTEDLPPVYWVEARPRCDQCGDFEVMEVGQICTHCEKEWSQHYQVMSLAGRCSNGAELDHGTKYHAVEFCNHRAFCGAKPGKRSVGWSREFKEVSCPRCLAKLARIEQRAKENAAVMS